MDMAATTYATSETKTTVHRAILFTDVVGSTEELERIGVDAWARVLDHHRRSVQAIVSSRRGVVSSFTGDGYMVAFDDVASGVDAALRLQWAMWAQRELAVRIGVASGAVLPMTTGNFLGLTVNRASRLCDACETGEVLIDEQSWRTATVELALEPLEAVAVAGRGFRTPIRARRAGPLSTGSLA
jgi:class 3 adenylate cyclase